MVSRPPDSGRKSLSFKRGPRAFFGRLGTGPGGPESIFARAIVVN